MTAAAGKRLVGGVIKVNDRQPTVRKNCIIHSFYAMGIRTAAGNGLSHAFSIECCEVRCFEVVDPGNTAHDRFAGYLAAAAICVTAFSTALLMAALNAAALLSEAFSRSVTVPFLR